jgi:hypothetical protein
LSKDSEDAENSAKEKSSATTKPVVERIGKPTADEARPEIRTRIF